MIQRRGFLLGAAGCIIGAHAPAIVRASSLMRIREAESVIDTISGLRLLMDSQRMAEKFYNSTVFGQNAEKPYPMEIGVDLSRGVDRSCVTVRRGRNVVAQLDPHKDRALIDLILAARDQMDRQWP